MSALAFLHRDDQQVVILRISMLCLLLVVLMQDTVLIRMDDIVAFTTYDKAIWRKRPVGRIQHEEMLALRLVDLM